MRVIVAVEARFWNFRNMYPRGQTAPYTPATND